MYLSSGDKERLRESLNLIHDFIPPELSSTLNFNDPLDFEGEAQHGLKFLPPILEENLLILGKKRDQLAAELEQNLRNIRIAQRQLTHFPHLVQFHEQNILQTLSTLKNKRTQLARDLEQTLEDWEVVHRQLNHFLNLVQELEQAVFQTQSSNEDNARLRAITAIRDFLDLM